jgi:hypothetical protein
MSLRLAALQIQNFLPLVFACIEWFDTVIDITENIKVCVLCSDRKRYAGFWRLLKV